MEELLRDNIEMECMRKAEIMAALSHPLRLYMALELYKHGPQNVKGFVDMLGVSQPAVSQHLTRMRVSGVVDMRKEGTRVFYSVNDPFVVELLQLLNKEID